MRHQTVGRHLWMGAAGDIFLAYLLHKRWLLSTFLVDWQWYAVVPVHWLCLLGVGWMGHRSGTVVSLLHLRLRLAWTWHRRSLLGIRTDARLMLTQMIGIRVAMTTGIVLRKLFDGLLPCVDNLSPL